MPPDVLWHYCSLDSFVKIITTKTLRMSSLYHMNDRMEHYWLRKLASRVIGEITDAQYEDYLKELDNEIRTTGVYLEFGTSFSSDKDSLSQWRQYADNCRGVAIGFRSDYFRECASKSVNALQLIDIIYDPKQQEDIVRKHLEMRTFAPSASDPVAGKLARFFTHHSIMRDACRCKNPCYREEKEWRLVHRNTEIPPNAKPDDLDINKTVDFFVRGNTLTPFVSLRLHPDKNPIQSLQYGSKARGGTQHPWFNMFLKMHDFAGVSYGESACTDQDH
jgi:hypothetical protein